MVRKRKLQAASFAFVLIAVIACAFYMLINSRTFQFYGGIINRVATNEKVIALTFDDGPTERTTEILAVLKEQNIKATFFVTGYALEQHMAYGEMIVAAGHELGNHSFSHRRLIFASQHEAAYEVETTDSLIRKAGYKERIYFRPPYGKKFFSLPYYLCKHNRQTIMCDVEPDSPGADADPARVTADAIRNAKPGSVILLHVMFGSRDNSMKAISGIVTGLKNKGYTFVTVSELLRYERK